MSSPHGELLRQVVELQVCCVKTHLIESASMTIQDGDVRAAVLSLIRNGDKLRSSFIKFTIASALGHLPTTTRALYCRGRI